MERFHNISNLEPMRRGAFLQGVGGCTRYRPCFNNLDPELVPYPLATTAT